MTNGGGWEGREGVRRGGEVTLKSLGFGRHGVKATPGEEGSAWQMEEFMQSLGDLDKGGLSRGPHIIHLRQKKTAGCGNGGGGEK
ncbi:unnamed protein product, partial [Rangifer tarandus platyrhynchus]